LFLIQGYIVKVTFLLKKNVIYTSLLCGTLSGLFLSSNVMAHAVTYKLTRGRFGDNLHTLVHALWLSYTQDLCMLFQPFKYSRYLKIHYVYEHITRNAKRAYRRHIVTPGDSTHLTLLDTQEPSLYITTYVESPGLEPWSNDGFVQTLRTLIAPNHDLHYPPLPHNMHTIALHVRRGGNRDTDNTRKGRPFQFPEIAYYTHALQIILSRLEGHCYLHLFTDDLNPAGLVEEIIAQCSAEDRNRITIEWRKEGNRDDAYVVEDFFDMMRFEYLIRARSNFSLYVERLGTCKVAIVPTKADTGNPWDVVTQASITMYGDPLSRTRSVTKKVVPFEV
jgi:hypothetical protein